MRTPKQPLTAPAGGPQAQSEHVHPVTVVIPSYRDFRLVERLVRSLHDTAGADLVRVIVCDDASGSRHLARLRGLPETEVIAGEDNVGFAANANRGLRAAGPDRDVVVLNSDAICLPGWLSALQRTARSTPGVGAVGPQLRYPDGRIQFAGTIRDPQLPAQFAHRHRGLAAELDTAQAEGPILALTGACMYLTRSALDRVGLFDECYAWAYEDVDWCLRCWQLGLSVLYQPEAVLIHEESQVRGPREHEREAESQRQFWQRWSAFFDERPVSEGSSLRVVYACDGPPSAEVCSQVEGLRGRGHRVEVFGVGAIPPPARGFETMRALEEAMTPLDAIKLATGPATAAPVWAASVVHGRPALLTDGQSIDAIARHEFRHLTTVPSVYGRLSVLGFNSTLLPRGHDQAALDVLEGSLRAMTASLQVDSDMAMLQTRLHACEEAYAAIQRSLSWRLTAPLRAAKTSARAWSARRGI